MRRENGTLNAYASVVSQCEGKLIKQDEAFPRTENILQKQTKTSFIIEIET
jgi:hypothetical protein